MSEVYIKKSHACHPERLAVPKKLAFWGWIVFTLMGMGLFIRLGYWQLQRADEKRQSIAAYHRGLQAPVLPLAQVDSPQPYQRVLLTGHYLPVTLLLDNQHHDHQYGYDVLSPFELESGGIIIVDRGWIPGDSSRQQWPTIQIPSRVMTLIGQVYYPSKKSWVLGRNMEIKTKDLVVIEALDMTMLSQFLHKSLYPFIIRQSEGHSGKYVRDWPVIASSPERHVGYAIQWFLFAGISALLCVLLNVKKKR